MMADPITLQADWRPIETAPRDGTRFLGYWSDIFGNGCDSPAKTWFQDGRWHSPWEDAAERDAWTPTHWMPLPLPPQGALDRAALGGGQLCNRTVREAPVVTPRAWTDVMGERIRQMLVEGWTPEHDDEHAAGQMAGAAACYALTATDHWANGAAIQTFWPWEVKWWKPSDRRRNLVKSGALTLAEIERLDRAALAKGGTE